MKKKLFYIFIIFFFIGFSSFSQDQTLSSWKILENAQLKFDSGNYGESLNLANKALNQRKYEVNSEYNILDIAITPAQVRRAGEDIKEVLNVLVEREQKDAVSVIEKYLKLYGKDFFDNNIHNLVNWLKNKAVYPEADYLIGQIYQMEGEFNTAVNFYNKAYSEKEYLDIPDIEFDILYSLAYLYKINDDLDKFEKTLLLILDDDSYFKNELLKSSVLRNIDLDRAENVDRLFYLYRAESKYSLKALYELSFIYESRDDEDKALVCSALAAIEAFTHIFNTIIEHDSRFVYTDLKMFLVECSKYEEIVNWGRNNNVWESFYLFAERAGKHGKLVFAQELYLVLSQSIPDEYYRALCAKRIIN